MVRPGLGRQALPRDINKTGKEGGLWGSGNGVDVCSNNLPLVGGRISFQSLTGMAARGSGLGRVHILEGAI